MVDPSPSENRPTTPPTAASLLVGRIGWILVIVLSLLTAFLASRNLALNATVRILRTNAELDQVEVQSLKQQIAAERILTARQIADLTAKAKTELPIFIQLSPPETSAPGFVAMIAWQPSAQAGTFFSDQLPLPGPDEEYRLWIETNTGNPVGAGRITVDSTQKTKTTFKAEQAVGQAVRFTLTREQIGRVDKPSGPVILSGLP